MAPRRRALWLLLFTAHFAFAAALHDHAVDLAADHATAADSATFQPAGGSCVACLLSSLTAQAEPLSAVASEAALVGPLIPPTDRPPVQVFRCAVTGRAPPQDGAAAV